MTDKEYYDDPSKWGDSQFEYLEDIINNYMAVRGSDDHDSMALRTQVLINAKRGVRELYFDVAREVKGIELELNPRLIVPAPPDFVDWVRVSWVDESGALRPMATNRSQPIANTYLQDNEYEILFDVDGEALIGGTVFGNSPKRFATVVPNNEGEFTPNIIGSNSYPNGNFTFDPSTGVFQFSSDVDSKSIILEYISDGINLVDTSKIRVHKYASTALTDFIYYENIKRRKNVPAYEKQAARKEYYNSRRIAKRRINALKIEDLKQMFKGSKRWVK